MTEEEELQILKDEIDILLKEHKFDSMNVFIAPDKPTNLKHVLEDFKALLIAIKTGEGLEEVYTYTLNDK